MSTSELQSRLEAIKYPLQKMRVFHDLSSRLYKDRNRAAIDAVKAFDFAGLEAEISAVNAQREAIVAEYRAKMVEARATVLAIFGEKSKEYRYVKALYVRHEPRRLDFPTTLIVAVERELKNRAESSELVINVRRYLAEKGDTEIPTDAQAVEKAADIRFAELIEEQLLRLSLSDVSVGCFGSC